MERAEEEAGEVAAIREPIKAELENAVVEGAATAAAAVMRERERMVLLAWYWQNEMTIRLYASLL